MGLEGYSMYRGLWANGYMLATCSIGSCIEREGTKERILCLKAKTKIQIHTSRNLNINHDNMC